MIFLQKPGLVRDDSTSFQAVGAVLIFSLCHCHFCPPLCYRLSHYDRCSSFLVLLGLLADKLSVMEMGRKGSKRRPRAQRYERKNWMAVRVMVIDSFGLMIVWAGCFPLLSFSCSFFFFLFLILSGRMPTGYWGWRWAMTHRDLEDVQENTVNPCCLTLGSVSLLL